MPSRKTERFPLTLHHATGQWSKCFTLPGGRRKSVYFGTDRDTALAQYLAERDDWQAGRNPRQATTATTAETLADLINGFLSRSKNRVALGELSPVTFADYLWVGERMAAHFGRNRDPEQLTPTEFASFRSEIAAKYAPSRLSKTITVCRMMFKWGYESGLLDRPLRFGPDFKVAGKRLARSHKATLGMKLLTATDINSLLQQADPQFVAMILLGINGAMGNADIAALPTTALDLDNGILDFPRPKTGVARRVPLWPETVDALRVVLANRRPRPENEQLVFVTSRGGALVTVKPDGKRVDQIIEPFRKLAAAAGVHRPRMGFYWLRHTLQTIGDEARDPLATAHVMGHADGTIGGNYRETISDDRLRRVTDHVREWLFGKVKAKRKAKTTATPKLRAFAG